MAGYKLATYQIRRRTARRPRRRRQGVRRRQADRQAGLRDRARHPERLEEGAGRAEGGGRQGRPRQGEAAARARPSCWRRCTGPRRSIVQARTTRTMPPRWRQGTTSRRRPIRTRSGCESWHFIKASRSISNPGRDRQDFRLFEEDGLGGRARRRHRQARQERADGQGAELRRRLHHRQRSLGARPRPPAAYPRHLAVQGRLGGAQELRRLLPARTLDRAGERHQGPAEPRPSSCGSTASSSRIPTPAR